MATILAIDLGKYKSVACIYRGAKVEPTFRTAQTLPGTIHDLIVEVQPSRVVIEIGAAAGWIKDLCEALGVPIEIANPNHEAWRWKNTKRKTDRDDALKLAKLSEMGQLPTVELPATKVRQWRSLIGYRATLVGRRTAIKNHLRAILDRQGLRHPSGKSGWTKRAMAKLQAMSRNLADCAADELWRGQLDIELRALEQAQALIKQVEGKLGELADADDRVARLQSIPGVGPRLSELVVAVIDDPNRFNNGRQVASYVGLCPKQYESGTMSRSGRITGQGHRLLRSLLIEVGWLMRRYNPHFATVFDRVCRASKSRRKVAVVAVARRLIVTCWAMLRDGTTWRPPAPGSGAAPGSPGSPGTGIPAMNGLSA